MDKNAMAGIARAGSKPSRREAITLLGQAAASAAIGLAIPKAGLAQAAKPLQGASVVFSSWGGAYQAAQKVAFCEPFAAQTGATVVQDGPVDYGKYRAMLKSGTPTWDVVDVTIDF